MCLAHRPWLSVRAWPERSQKCYICLGWYTLSRSLQAFNMVMTGNARTKRKNHSHDLKTEPALKELKGVTLSFNLRHFRKSVTLWSNKMLFFNFLSISDTVLSFHFNNRPLLSINIVLFWCIHIQHSGARFSIQTWLHQIQNKFIFMTIYEQNIIYLTHMVEEFFRHNSYLGIVCDSSKLTVSFHLFS